MFLAAWPLSATAKDNTWYTMWEMLCWSFRALLDGRHPMRDLAGFADSLDGTGEGLRKERGEHDKSEG